MTITRMCVCACELVTCESLYPRGHCLWVKTALSVASLICRNYVSQSARSQSHTYIDSLSSWFFLFFHLLFSSMCFFFLRRPESWLPQGDWQCVCVCIYSMCVTLAMGLLSCRDTAQRNSLHSSRVNKEMQ